MSCVYASAVPIVLFQSFDKSNDFEYWAHEEKKRTALGEPGQFEEVGRGQFSILQFQRKLLALVLGTVKNTRTASPVRKQCPVRIVLPTAPSPARTREKPCSKIAFIWPCQSTSCERKCASDKNGIVLPIDIWFSQAPIAADDLLQPDFDSCMFSDWKCTVVCSGL